MFTTLLIANRGEIAVRLIRACRRLGIRAIAVYSDADARALHVLEADEAHRLGPAPAAESYLNQAAVLRAARVSGAEAIHPGYGFLAENPGFAQACLDAGLAWVGPPPAAMRLLGDKARAKALARRAGVPLLPGSHGESQDPERLAEAAVELGYPLLIKASAGGGGRGMRVVERADQLAAQLEAARREALASFGDGRVLLERYLRRPRHVEVQVLGDRFGHLVHLGERECSIQRRHQKLVEETPSPAVSPALREEMGVAALRLARAAGYASAGTVEFLLDEDGRFAFLEVNTRLQVEHPVTEAVAGLDLAALQISVAAGEALPFSQADVRLDGHAIECRIVAEDPLAGFLPSAGTVVEFAVPPFVRTDAGVYPGAPVPSHYDSLLAKVVAHGTDRAAALERMIRALRETRVAGVRTNVDLLLATLEHPAFRAGALHTSFLAEHGIVDALAVVPDEVVAVASAHDLLASAAPAADPWRGPGAWRVGRIDQPSRWVRAGRCVEALAAGELESDAVSVAVEGRAVWVEPLARPASLGPRRLRVGGADTAVVHVTHPSELVVEWRGRSYRLQREVERAGAAPERAAHGGAGRGVLTAPMPGRVAKVAVRAGARVQSNQPLLVLEAMKMEHVIEAPHAGVVTAVHVAEGEQAARGAVLVEIGEEG